MLALLLLLFCCTGATCNHRLQYPFGQSGPPAPEVLVAGSSLEQVIAAVNQNSGRIQSYQTNNASISIPGMVGVPALRGNIVAQRPGRLRLEASTALTGPEVDLGSNDELFWFWVKRNEPPALYFSRHDQFVGSAAQQVMPIEPQWLLDAMGFAQFSPNDNHEGPIPHGNGTVEIRSFINSPSGTMTKSTVINALNAQIMEQHIYNSQGTLLASSRAKSHRYYPGIGVSLPQSIEVNLPVAQLSLSIDVGTVSLNALPNNPALWTLPNMSGYPQIDLGAAPPGAVSAINRAGSSDWNTFASPAFVGITPEMNSTAGAYPSTPGNTPTTGFPSGNSATEPQVAQAPVTVTLPPTEPVPQQLRPGGVPMPGTVIR